MLGGNFMLAGLGLDENYVRMSSGMATSLLADGLGSTAVLSNSSATTTATYAYSPYGDTAKTGSDSTPLDYTGRENDGATGLYYYRARYYSPALGRFISEDPIGLRGSGTNFYAYARGAPTTLRDPTGMVSAGDEASAAGLVPVPPTSVCFSANSVNWRAPDFITFQIDAYVFSFSATYTRNGDIFLGDGLTRQYNDARNIGVSIADGWLISAAEPTASQLNDFLVGYSAGASAYALVGGGYAVNGSGQAVTVGVGVGTNNTWGSVTPGSVNTYLGNIFNH